MLTSRLHLNYHISSGPKACYISVSLAWLVSEGDHLIVAEDWFMTSFPHRYLHGVIEASCICELMSALPQIPKAHRGLQLFKVHWCKNYPDKFLKKICAKTCIRSSCAHMWCTAIQLLSLFTTILSTANLIPARLCSQLPCKPSNADKL